MSVDNSEMIAIQKALEALQNDIPEIMDRLAVEEGEYARDQAVLICQRKNIHRTGHYMRGFDLGRRAIRAGKNYKIDVFNNVEYAKHLEYGFRGHWVPGRWEGKSFVYMKGYREGGMYVKFTPGHLVLTTAVENTKKTQDARLERKYREELERRGLGKYADL